MNSTENSYENLSEFFNSWDIEIKEEYKELYHNFFSSDYIKYFDENEQPVTELFIDTTKEHFSLLEKIIYDIGMFHFKRLNIEFDENKHKIEFWIPRRDTYNKKDNTISSLHIDCDEQYRVKHNKRISPFLSTVTYINYDSNTNNPTIVTNIPENNSDISIKDKLLQHNKFYFSFPKFLKHISFEGGKYYHGILNYADNTGYREDKRQVLAIGLWDKEVFNNNYFTSNYDNMENVFLQTIPKNTNVITVKKNILNTKLLVKKEENQNHRFFILKKINTMFQNIYNSFYKIENIFNYKMRVKNEEMLYFKEIIKENNKDGLYDNFCIHYT